MKKLMIGCTLWIFLLSIAVSGKAESKLEYQIQYDSKTTDTYPMKRKIEDIYRELISGVHEESYILMVLHNKDLFAYQKDMQVDWKANRLFIMEGDGKGDKIKGTLEANSVCVPQVQPRSYLAELF